jgi:hypothetical protein
VNDRVKLFAYRVFDPMAEPLLCRAPADVKAQVARRAYLQAEQEIRKK